MPNTMKTVFAPHTGGREVPPLTRSLMRPNAEADRHRRTCSLITQSVIM